MEDKSLAAATPLKPGEKPKKAGILEKTTAFFAGLIINILIIGAILKIITSIWGMLIGTVISVGGAIYLLKKQKSMYSQMAAKGMITSAVLFIVISLVLWTMLLSAFQGIAN